MKALMNKKLLVLSAVALLGLAACNQNQGGGQGGGGQGGGGADRPSTYVRESDDTVYARVLGDFQEKYEGVNDIADDNLRFVRDARAEAALLASGVFVPTTTQGGAYTMSRIAPRTAPYVFFGNDSDKLKDLIMTAGEDSFIKKADRAELIAAWEVARGGGAAYDPAAILTGKGYSLGTEYKTTYSTAPVTMDILNTSEQADTETLVNLIEGLIQYNSLGEMVGASASAWEANDDNTIYKFTIREGAAWYTADKTKYADVTADDFVAGFQHMLDCAAGLEYLVQGVVKGVDEYLAGTGDFEDVGCYVEEETGKLVFELDHSESFFLTRLAYSCFSPINRTFYESKGGKFGDEFDAADAGYQYAKVGTLSSQLYNSAFIPTEWSVSNGSIVLEKNANYWDAANVKVTKATWVYDDGSNPLALYNACRQGDLPGIGLGESTGLLKQSKDDELFDQFAYVSDTNATTFFGGMNTNRGAFVLPNGNVKSNQSEDNKVLTHAALDNVHFRRAILYGWDRASWNAITRGEDLKATNLRNMYTQPEFVGITADVEYEGKTYDQGTSYGKLVEQFLKSDYDMEINLDDGQDGWFNAEKALAEMALAKEDLKGFWRDGEKVVIDNVALGTSISNIAQANAFEKFIEQVLGDYVDVHIHTALNTTDYYACGYRAKEGVDVNQDLFYGSGWGPDYGDPSTYLDTFTAGGYMTKVVGLY